MNTIDMNHTYRLENGLSLPVIGYGTAPLKTSIGSEMPVGIDTALRAGYRLIDTAWAYKNEDYLGEAIRRSGISRSELMISSKCSNRFRGYERATACCKESLSLLGLDYLDLYLIHWPAKDGPEEEWVHTNNETWRAFEDLYREGLVRAIGVSNFWPRHLEPLMKSASVQPMILQLEYHPGYMQEGPVAFAKEHHMVVEAWSPLGTGQLLKNETLRSIADAHGKSVAQVILHWCIRNEIIPLPKSNNEGRIRENLQLDDFLLTEDEMQTISSMEYFGGSGWTPDTIDW